MWECLRYALSLPETLPWNWPALLFTVPEAHPPLKLHRLRNPKLPRFPLPDSHPLHFIHSGQLVVCPPWTTCEPCRRLGHALRSLLPHRLRPRSTRIGLPTRSPVSRPSSGRDPPVRRVAGSMAPGRSGQNRCTCCMPLTPL